MATGIHSDFKIYDEQFVGGYVEVQTQNINAFNAASNGTITMVSNLLKGHYEKEAFFKNISGLVSRRDIDSTSAATAVKLQHGENISVKLNRKIGPAEQTGDAFRKMGRDAQEMSFILGQMAASAATSDFLNSAVRATAAALAGQSAIVHDYSATGTLTHSALSTGMWKFGDQTQRVKAWIMHSKAAGDLMAQGIADKVTEVAGATIITGAMFGLGRPIIVTDSAALVVSGTPNKYRTLGLVEGATTITESEVRDVLFEKVSGLENIVYRYQAEFAYNVGVRGFQWDVANGGVNPTDTAVGTSSNWDKVASSDKDLAGVLVLTQ